VADTWNFQVKVLSPSGELLRTWGEQGEYGLGAQPDPVYGFWGPRDVVVDSAGRVYVADTGNKRIRVYSSNGDYLRDLGSGGSAEGQLDEPSGLALHPDGRLFVADYWNRRVSVFDVNTAEFLYAFPVRAWYDEQGNRPYLAVDPERNLVYVTDPDAGRVLVYDTTGNCQGSFGQASRENPDASQFRTTAGLAVDASGNVYVSDAGTGRVLRFTAFESGLPEPVNEDLDAAPADSSSVEEATEESLPDPVG
jgi:DNA-binding beta-propeller fold protein YncE